MPRENSDAGTFGFDAAGIRSPRIPARKSFSQTKKPRRGCLRGSRGFRLMKVLPESELGPRTSPDRIDSGCGVSINLRGRNASHRALHPPAGNPPDERLPAARHVAPASHKALPRAGTFAPVRIPAGGQPIATFAMSKSTATTPVRNWSPSTARSPASWPSASTGSPTTPLVAGPDGRVLHRAVRRAVRRNAEANPLSSFVLPAQRVSRARANFNALSLRTQHGLQKYRLHFVQFLPSTGSSRVSTPFSRMSSSDRPGRRSRDEPDPGAPALRLGHHAAPFHGVALAGEPPFHQFHRAVVLPCPATRPAAETPSPCKAAPPYTRLPCLGPGPLIGRVPHPRGPKCRECPSYLLTDATGRGAFPFCSSRKKSLFRTCFSRGLL